MVTPNPFTSGGAKWNIMAAYGSQIEQGKSDAEAQQFLRDLLANVLLQDKSAREALETFTGRQGRRPDRLRERGDRRPAGGRGPRVRDPRRDDPDREPRGRAQGLGREGDGPGVRRLLTTEPAQKLFAEKGYRPVLPELVDKKVFPDPKTQFEIDKFGGWDAVNDKFFDPEKGVIARDQPRAGAGHRVAWPAASQP